MKYTVFINAIKGKRGFGKETVMCLKNREYEEIRAVCQKANQSGFRVLKAPMYDSKGNLREEQGRALDE